MGCTHLNEVLRADAGGELLLSRDWGPQAEAAG